jgi:two-component system sensor histidine kinase GlrK
MIDNLLSNAVKFSPPGGVIGISARYDGDALELDVTDEGPGIPSEERARIFDPFYQGSHTGAGPVRGTGIGLSVVKEYVFAHGGSVEVLSRQRGAHLRIRLPLIRAEAAPS